MHAELHSGSKHRMGTVALECAEQLTARSTRCSLPMRTCIFPSTPFSLHSIVIVKIAWERELCSFILVAPTEPVYIEKPKYRLKCTMACIGPMR